MCCYQICLIRNNKSEKVKRKPTEWKKILTNHISHKGSLLPPLTLASQSWVLWSPQKPQDEAWQSRYPTSLPTLPGSCFFFPHSQPHPSHHSLATLSRPPLWPFGGPDAPLPEVCPQLPTPSYSAIVWPSARLQWLVYKRRVLFSYGQCNKFLQT